MCVPSATSNVFKHLQHAPSSLIEFLLLSDSQVVALETWTTGRWSRKKRMWRLFVKTFTGLIVLQMLLMFSSMCFLVFHVIKIQKYLIARLAFRRKEKWEYHRSTSQSSTRRYMQVDYGCKFLQSPVWELCSGLQDNKFCSLMSFVTNEKKCQQTISCPLDMQQRKSNSYLLRDSFVR